MRHLASKRRHRSHIMAVTAALALLATACPADDPDDPDAPENGEVHIMGAFVDEHARSFERAIESFEEETGIDVTYEGSGDFETLIVSRVEGGNPPDIALFPQPGLMRDLAEGGHLRELSDILEVDRLEQQLVPGLLELGTHNDELVGVPYTVNIKSLVWYPIQPFEEAGYEIPETWDELHALSDQIRDDGTAPWCVGIESAGATGWVATDWVEDVMLRTAGPDAYDDWVDGELPFDSPEVRHAFETVGDIWFEEGYVLGGTTAIITTPFGDAPAPLFDDPPSCFLHRQAGFITGFFPEDVEVGVDVDFFYLPPIEEEHGSPVLGAGDVGSLLTDNPSAEEVLRFLTTPEALEERVQTGGDLSPNTEFDASVYPTESQRRQFEILVEADVYRFDASDMMPGAVGAGTFWTESVNWIEAEGDNLDEVLQRIDDSWPE